MKSSIAAHISVAQDYISDVIDYEDRPHELRTAIRPCSYGVRADFQNDEKDWTDPRVGLNQPRGKADLTYGYELNTLANDASFSTIDGCLSQTSMRKSDAVAVVLDNTENSSMSDEGLAECILRSRRFRRGRKYLLSEYGFWQIR